MPSINEIVATAQALRNRAEYDATPHNVKLPTVEAPVVIATLVVDQLGRPQIELVLVDAAEQQRLDEDGNPVLDEEGNPIIDPVDRVLILAGTWSEWAQIESTLEPALASLARDAIGQLWCTTK